MVESPEEKAAFEQLKLKIAREIRNIQRKYGLKSDAMKEILSSLAEVWETLYG
jgi:hypothetical protein